MKTMPTGFKKYGDTFNLTKRDGDVCLYTRSRDGDKDVYEVVIVQKTKKDMYIKGRLVANAGDERMPSSEMWGTKGWTYQNLDQAELRFAEQAELRHSIRAGGNISPNWYHKTNWPSSMRKGRTYDENKQGI